MIRPNFLTVADRLELLSCVKRQREDHGVARRANALLLLNDGMSCAQIAKVLFLDDDTRPEVNAFRDAFETTTGAGPSSTYAYPGYLLIDMWATAVERAGTVEASAVTAQLEMMQNEPTIFGPRSFSDMIHHQNSAEMQIIEITDGVPGVIGSFTISEPVPLEVLLP